MHTNKEALRVLVVDDDADQANTLAVLLERSGYQPCTCLCSQDCMAIVERIRPHVILLDLSMPGMTGFDIAEEIDRNSDLRPARLVAVTGLARDADRERTKASGFDHHLLKPVDWQELRPILEMAQRIQEVGRLPDAEIRHRAYAKWEAAGRPDSDRQDRDHFWYAAQRELVEEKLRADQDGQTPGTDH